MKIDARRILSPALSVVVLAVGCQSFPYFSGGKQATVAPPVSKLSSPDAEHVSQWEAGRQIYLNQCAKCHEPKPIHDFSIDEWKTSIIPKMTAKAKLSSEQTETLAAYIMAVKRQQLLGNDHARASVPTTVSVTDTR